MTAVLRVPASFANIAILKYHVEQHHGYFFGDIKNVREGRAHHAAMHGQAPTAKKPDPFLTELAGADAAFLADPVPHIHDSSATELTVVRFE